MCAMTTDPAWQLIEDCEERYDDAQMEEILDIVASVLPHAKGTAPEPTYEGDLDEAAEEETEEALADEDTADQLMDMEEEQDMEEAEDELAGPADSLVHERDVVDSGGDDDD